MVVVVVVIMIMMMMMMMTVMRTRGEVHSEVLDAVNGRCGILQHHLELSDLIPRQDTGLPILAYKIQISNKMLKQILPLFLTLHVFLIRKTLFS